jgi:hypothetical protein
MGVEPLTPPALLVRTAVPTANDSQNINIGSFWLVESPMELWYLAALTQGQATWLQLYPTGGGGATEFVCNTGTATEAAGILNLVGDGVSITTAGSGNTVTISVLGEVDTSFHADTGTATPSAGVTIMAGGTNMNTSASGNTVTFNLDNSVSLSGTLGVTGNTTLSSALILSAQGVVQTNSSGVVTSSNGTNGQVLIGGGTHPVWANLTSLGATVTITNGPNSINLEATGGGGGGGTTPIAFYAYQPTTYQVPIVSAAPPSAYAPYLMGSGVAMTTVLNGGGGFYPGDGAGTPASFTAPISGKYFFSFTPSMGQGFSAGVPNIIQDCYAVIITPTTNYVGYSGRPTASTVVASFLIASPTSNTTVQLTQGDVVTFQTLGPTLTNTAMGNYCYTVVGAKPANVFPTGVANYFPTSIEGFLLEAVETAGTVSFSAYNPTDTTVSAGVIYSYGSLTALTVESNVGSAFFPGDGLGTPASFTAPVNGYYAFNMISEIQALGGGQPSTLVASIVAPGNTYSRKHFDSQTGAGPAVSASVSVSALVTLNASDVVTFTVSDAVAPGGYRVRGPLAYSPSATLAVNNLITGYLVSEF